MKRIAIISFLLVAWLCSVAQTAQTEKKPELKDWAKFGRYAEDNARVKASGERPVAVFMGNSIFDVWGRIRSGYFASHNFVCRGISGQTTSQMLVRFRRDVIDLHPEIVVIMGGTNDLAQNKGIWIAHENTLGNIQSMCELAMANDIRPIVCTIPPSIQFKWNTAVDAVAEIKALNALIREFAAENGITCIDIYSAMADERCGIPEKWARDTTHPNEEGYEAVFEPLITEVVARERIGLTNKKQINEETMIYPIVVYGSPVLRNKSVDIDASYPDFKKLVDDMFTTLTEASGVGLAAPQIGLNIRMFIVDCTPWGDENPELANYKKVFVNPEIYERSEDTGLFEEGCLSLPGIHENVRRPNTIRMRYLDENFVAHDECFNGLPARVIQHEYDHIEGHVFTDHLSPLRRNLLRSKILNLAKGKYRCDYKTKR